MVTHIMTMAIPVTQQPSHPHQNEDYPYVDQTLISRVDNLCWYPSNILFGITILLLQANCYKCALTMGIPVSPQPSIPLENRRARTCREYSNWGGYILVLLLELSSFFNCSGGRISINGQNSEMTENQYSLAIL